MIISNLNKKNQGKLDKAIQSYMDFYGIEGASFLALKDGKIAYQQVYGVKNNYTKEKVSEETLFEVASITKPVFAFVVLRLYEKGIIDLDKPLYQYLAFEKKTNQEYAKLITARHVLSHQTGFPNWARNENLEFLFRPGTAFGYSGEGFEYLKRVVEKITDKNIVQVLQEELIEPLELENFHFEMNEAVLKHKAHGHFNSYSGLIDMFDPPLMAASLVTNPKSFAKFMLALQERKGLKPETYKLFFSPQITVPKDVRENQGDFEEYMSLGLFVEKTPYGRVFRHSGNNGDFKGVFRVFEDLEVAYILMVNGNTGFYLVDAIDKILVDIEEMKQVTEQ